MSSSEDEMINLEHTVGSHDDDLTRHEKDIKTLKESLALLVEAVAKIDLCALQGMAHTTIGEQSQKRIREILKQLNAPPPTPLK